MKNAHNNDRQWLYASTFIHRGIKTKAACYAQAAWIVFDCIGLGFCFLCFDFSLQQFHAAVDKVG